MLSGMKRLFTGADPVPDEGRTILLTGIPRSGTTLACRLLLTCPGVIALHEPFDGALFQNRAGALEAIAQEARRIRQQLLERGEAPARSSGSPKTDNNFSSDSGPRTLVAVRQMVRFDPWPRPGFTLILKQNAEFTLLFPELLSRFTVFALIRHPLAVLASWDTVSIAASRGRIAKSERLQPALAQALEQLPDLMSRRLAILDWYFQQFALLPASHVLRYESLIATQGTLLSEITGTPVTPDSGLRNQNDSHLYTPRALEEAYQALTSREGAWMAYYDREAIDTLYHQLLTP